MKRILWYIVILAIVAVLPVERADVGKLRPVQAVSIYEENGWVVMETDTKDLGIGATPTQALQNLKDTTSGIIYLDTAEYLLLGKGMEYAAEELRAQLRKSVGLCIATEGISPEKAASYLSAHADLPKLKHWKKGGELPVITTFGERITFLKKVENNA